MSMTNLNGVSNLNPVVEFKNFISENFSTIFSFHTTRNPGHCSTWIWVSVIEGKSIRVGVENGGIFFQHNHRIYSLRDILESQDCVGKKKGFRVRKVR